MSSIPFYVINTFSVFRVCIKRTLRELHFAYGKAKENKKKVVIVNIDNCKMTDEFSFNVWPYRYN